MGITRKTAERIDQQVILSRKEIEAEVVYDVFFDFSKATDFKQILIRILNILGIILVWLVTFVPGIITLAQIFYNLHVVNVSRPFLYLSSTQHLFDNFTQSTLITLMAVTIIIALLACYRIYFQKKGFFSLKFQSFCKKNLEEIEDKKEVLEFHFSSKLGDEIVRKNRAWIVIAPDENIDADEIEILYDDYIK